MIEAAALYPSVFANCPDSWKIVPFASAVDFREGPGILAKDFRESGVPLLRLRNIERPVVDVDGCNFLDPEMVEAKWAHFRVAAGDLLVSTSGTLGRVSIATPQSAGSIPYTGIIRMRPAMTDIDAGFIRYFLTSPLFQLQAEASAAGSVLRHFGPSHLREMSFPVPPLAEQRAIAGVLAALDDKIEQNRQTARALERLAQATFRAWFLDFAPVKAKAAGATSFPSMPQHVFDALPTFLIDSAIGPVPEGWLPKPVSAVFQVNPTRPLPRGQLAPYLDMKNMPTEGHAPDAWVVRRFGSGMRFMNGDTLVARITPCLENGKTAFVDFLEDRQIAWGSTEYIVLRPNSPVPQEFAYCLARTVEFRDFAIQNMTGTSGRQRVASTAMDRFLIAQPSELVAVCFGEIVQPLFKSIRAVMNETRKLVEILNYLLPLLLSGAIPVRTSAGRGNSD